VTLPVELHHIIMKLQLGVIIFLHFQALVSADCCIEDIKIVGAELNDTINGRYKYQGKGPMGMPIYKMLERNYTLKSTPNYLSDASDAESVMYTYAVMDPSGNVIAYHKPANFFPTCAESSGKEWVFPRHNFKVNALEVFCVSEDSGCCIEDIKIVGTELNHTINGLYKYQGRQGPMGLPIYKMLERNYTLKVIDVSITWTYAVLDPSGDILAQPPVDNQNTTYPIPPCAEDLSGQEWLDFKDDSTTKLWLYCTNEEDSGRCCPIKTVQGGPDSSLGGTYTLVKTLESPPESFCRDGCVYQKDGVHHCFDDEDTGYTVEECDATGAVAKFSDPTYPVEAAVKAKGLIFSGVCRWDGISPFCRGSCSDFEIKVKESKSGDGKTCSTGSKYYCCWVTDIRSPDGDNKFFIKALAASYPPN